jgi:hypothetical protein
LVSLSAIAGAIGEQPPAPPVSTPAPETPSRPEASLEQTPAPPQPLTALQGLPSWVTGVLLGGGAMILILGILVVVLLTRTPTPSPPSPPPPVAEVTPPSKPVSPPLVSPPAPGQPETAPPVVSLLDQVSAVLSNLQEAQLKKNIFLYMSCYSYIFPTLDDRRQEVLKSWENFNFISLNFDLEDLKSLGPDRARAKVTWDIQVQNRQTQEFQNFTQAYKVGFAQEMGHWRIRSLEEIEQ